VIVLLFSAGRRGQPARTVQAVEAVSATTRPDGEEMVLVTWHPPREDLAAAVGEVVVLGPSGTAQQTRTGQASLPAKVLGRLRDPGRVWRAARRNPRVRELAAQAGMLVALDTPATLTAWRLAKASPAPEAVLGFDAAAALLADGRGVAGEGTEVR
jgi:hypothetical protein